MSPNKIELKQKSCEILTKLILTHPHAQELLSVIIEERNLKGEYILVGNYELINKDGL